MRTLVLDSSCVLPWFRSANEPHVVPARRLRTAYRLRRVEVAVPPIFFLEMVNVAGRKWQFRSDQLDQLVARLDSLGFRTEQPLLADVARGVSLGLTAYDACYPAVARTLEAPLVTADVQMTRLASDVAVPIWSPELESLISGT